MSYILTDWSRIQYSGRPRRVEQLILDSYPRPEPNQPLPPPRLTKWRKPALPMGAVLSIPGADTTKLRCQECGHRYVTLTRMAKRFKCGRCAAVERRARFARAALASQ